MANNEKWEVDFYSAHDFVYFALFYEYAVYFILSIYFRS